MHGPCHGDKAVPQTDLLGDKAVMRASPRWLPVLKAKTCAEAAVVRHATNVKSSAQEASQGAMKTHDILWCREREVLRSPCSTFCFIWMLSRTGCSLCTDWHTSLTNGVCHTDM